MASSEDFKKLYELYQTEGVPNGVSIVDYPHQSGADDSAKQPNLPAAAVFGREAGGAMLAITGATRLWYVSNVTNMRFGKYRLFSEVQAQGMDAYNGDAYLFMSKNRRTLKINLCLKWNARIL